MARICYFTRRLYVGSDEARGTQVSSDGHAEKTAFPNGRYRHHVDLNVYAAEKKHFSFQGLAETTNERIRIVILSPFNTTLAKISEDRATGATQFEAYDSRIRQYQDKFAEYYGDLRQIFAMNFDEKKPEQAHHLEIKRPQYELQIEVEQLHEGG